MTRPRRSRRAYRARPRTAARRRSSAAGQAMPLRLILCGVIFVLLVAVKLLFPGAIGGFARSVGALLGRDADFRAAFAAVGRAVSGEGDVGDSLQDAYVAVFDPDARAAGDGTAPSQTAAPVDKAAGAAILRAAVPKLARPDLTAVRETELDAEALAAQAPEPDAAGWTYTYQPPPDNASMEQRNLGFAHCSPVVGGLNSSFGWRIHPLSGENRFHYGVDLGAPEGADILAFADGEVYATGESSTLGNYIMLLHEGGYITLYGHCSKVVVTSGAVTMGEKIAEVGATGQVTGPHLHFELHDGDLYLNPIYYVALA